MNDVKLTTEQFHCVWTEATGKDGYNKKLFQEVLSSLKDKNQFVDKMFSKEEVINLINDLVSSHFIEFSNKYGIKGWDELKTWITYHVNDGIIDIF